jgi:hypothetical protein
MFQLHRNVTIIGLITKAEEEGLPTENIQGLLGPRPALNAVAAGLDVHPPRPRTAPLVLLQAEELFKVTSLVW